MTQLTISVITCSYNQAEYIEKTILSVLNQNCEGFNVQYIIVDGGSTDGSIEIINKYISQIDLFICEKDLGQSDAINKGIRSATGDIICWLCSDDLFLPDTIAYVAKWFFNNPDKYILSGNAYIIDSKGNIIKKKLEIKADKYILLNDHNYICQPSTFWRKAVSEKIGPLNINLHYTMDLEFWVRILEHYTIYHERVLLSCMRRHVEQKITAKKVDVKQEFEYLRHSYYKNKKLSLIFMRFIAKFIRVFTKIISGCYR